MRKGHDRRRSKQARRGFQPAVVAGSSFSRIFRDQRPMLNKRDGENETEIQRDRPKRGKRKGGRM